jgi:murein DD-endopeptidase MepM/ murein hydrolase activator NlpD
MTFCIGLCGANYAEEQKRNKFQRAVDTQRVEDKKRKDELIARMKAIMGQFNTRLKRSGIDDANLDVPVDLNNIEDISDNSEKHSSKPEAPKIFAFVVADTGLYSSSEAEVVVGKVSFAEEIEVLEKVEQEMAFKGKQGFWVAVRRKNQDEGWIHSSFLAKDKPEKRGADKLEGGKNFDVPTSGIRTSNFGSRVDPVTKKRNAFHSGIDIGAPLGTPVYASSDGVIRQADFNKNGYGNLIIIEHAQDFTTYYGHLSKIKVKVGQTVKKGDNIGAVGSTGKSTGPHLHFEVRRGDKALDPDEFLK